ncbi:hypothetical protein RSPO_m01453 (plasmid) [Ralstonia solanacearum Po82]|uniref:Uncharacterized protein n=1 Tax=Ralstonia solanacearum (strain Po82) TaxID=1031711 RepID=F6GAV5_RALS8|nr:hypothetical protein RSPO_m01453 [Ralstonia solanacearum Po82]AMP71338.1 hypothetical protein UW163_17545 [Ralstonia solanacearum]OAI66280.1 hypothetical protein RSP797_23900 [Ralstonia solanacearum]
MTSGRHRLEARPALLRGRRPFFLRNARFFALLPHDALKKWWALPLSVETPAGADVHETF